MVYVTISVKFNGSGDELVDQVAKLEKSTYDKVHCVARESMKLYEDMELLQGVNRISAAKRLLEDDTEDRWWIAVVYGSTVLQDDSVLATKLREHGHVFFENDIHFGYVFQHLEVNRSGGFLSYDDPGFAEHWPKVQKQLRSWKDLEPGLKTAYARLLPIVAARKPLGNMGFFE
ncbi:hypothetical protein LTR66_011070 [Elasticomyces elasticus]|nr:hypothetical protein LTR66_011070 [Elasticomyces elasticus]